MPEFISPGTRTRELPDPLRLACGATLESVRIAYETVGDLNSRGDNVIVVMTGLSPSAHISSTQADPTDGWWERMVGPGRPIDTNQWHVICINSLGSCKGSTGPASTNPATGLPYATDFPLLAIEDIADAAAALLSDLGYQRVACVIGVSMGAMTSLALLERHPELTRAHISISGAIHSLPLALAIRSLQREAITSDSDWQLGRYNEARYPVRGMETARKLGLISYRAAAEWDERFGRERLKDSLTTTSAFGPAFTVEAYLNAHASRFVSAFDPNSYLYLSRALDHFDFAGGSDSHERLASLRLDDALVIGVTSDLLFPSTQQMQIAQGLQRGGTKTRFELLGCSQGHDSFLVDIPAFGAPIRRFLDDLAAAHHDQRYSAPVSA